MVLQSIVVDLERKLEMQGERDTPHSEKEIVGKAQQGDCLACKSIEQLMQKNLRILQQKSLSK